jgi:hypothetical protein
VVPLGADAAHDRDNGYSGYDGDPGYVVWSGANPRIAPSITGPTTRRLGRISATMFCGILAYKSKKERLKRGRSFSMPRHCSTLSQMALLDG